MDIPQFSDTQRVQQQELPSVRVQTDEPADAFGSGPAAQQAYKATDSTLGIIAKVAEEQKAQADQTAHLNADTQLSALQSDIQTKVAQMHGVDAITAPDFAKAQWDDGYNKVLSSMNNEAQQQAVQRSGTMLWSQLNKTTMLHSSTELNNYQNTSDESSIKQSQNAAVLNAGDDEIVANNADKVYAVVQQQAKRLGIPEPTADKESPVFQQMLNNGLSPLHREVIQARLDAGLDDAAKSWFEQNKDEMSAGDIRIAQDAITNQMVVGEGNQIFSDLSRQPGLKFSDGTFNLEKIKAEVNTENMSDKKGEALINYVSHQAAEYNANKNKSDQSLYRSFMNEAYKAKQDGVPLSQAISLATKWGTDLSEQANYADAIGKIYAPPSQSDPKTYMNLWEPVYSGQGSQQQIDQAKDNGQINVSDWRALTEANYKAKVDGTDPLTKTTNDRIKMLANEQFGSDQDAKNKFTYEAHLQGVGKSPQEQYKIAQDLLSKDPKTGFWGMFQDRKYEGDVKKSDAQALATGQVYEDVGQDVAVGIGRGMSKSTGKPWGLSDIDQFAKAFNGYSSIKQGTPVNNAVQTLLNNDRPATIGNVKALLKAYPDGNLPK